MRRVLVLTVVLAGCVGDVEDLDVVVDGGASAVDAASAPDGASATPDAGPAGEALGVFQLTYYWVTNEVDYPGVPDTDVFDPDCVVLATVSADFFDSLRLEGTGQLIDGRVINYWGACGCATSPCFYEVDADHPWGSGSMNRALVPFRSVAVDPAVVAIGDALYLPILDGLLMPGEAPWGDFIHDGCVSADDTGGGIDGMHLDLFAALREHYRDLDAELGVNAVDVFAGGARCAP